MKLVFLDAMGGPAMLGAGLVLLVVVILLTVAVILAVVKIIKTIVNRNRKEKNDDETGIS